MNQPLHFTLDKDKSFFDRDVVIRRLDKAAHRVLFKFGGKVRDTARKSQKKKGTARKAPTKQGSKAWQKWYAEVKDKPASPPGTPPYAHSDNPNQTLRKILYGNDSGRDNVIIGPNLIGVLTSPTVPELHEYGGGKRITEVEVKPGVWRPTGAKQKANDNRRRRKRHVKYPKRAFMQPALEKNLPKLDDMWANALEKVR